VRRFAIFLLAALGLYAVPAPAGAAASEAEAQVCESCEALLELALAHPRREGDRARDLHRHPAETLAFFQVRPGMTVVDYMPSGGWYTRVLVPYLGPEGHYIGLNPAVQAGMAEGMRNYLGGLRGKFVPETAKWQLQGASIEAFNSNELAEARNGTVDRVLIMREMHNLWRMNLLRDELLAVRRLLKADGLLGIEQHRAPADASAEQTDGSRGYLREKDVIALVEAHGFELVAKSGINANPRDPANHPGGVWMLPPNLRGVTDEAEKARLAAIGESDRMTLLFRKRP